LTLPLEIQAAAAFDAAVFIRSPLAGKNRISNDVEQIGTNLDNSKTDLGWREWLDF
jgi:hypothetical protein